MSDLISRQDVIDALVNLTVFKDLRRLRSATPSAKGNTFRDGIMEAIDAVENLPSARDALESAYQEGYTNAESKYREYLPKKGEWILTEDDNYEYCTCSECGYQNGENWMNGSDIPFCAMCGADMRGEKE